MPEGDEAECQCQGGSRHGEWLHGVWHQQGQGFEEWVPELPEGLGYEGWVQVAWCQEEWVDQALAHEPWGHEV